MPTSAYHKKDPSSIQSMFSSIASRYDLGNAAISCQLFRLWNRRLVQQVLLWPSAPTTMLDLCCGTGEITFTYLRQLQKSAFRDKPSQITLIDFAEGMLHEAERKAEAYREHASKLHFMAGDAQAIPLPNDSMDAVVIAYGIRNVADPSRCLQEVYRVLKPGGRVGILELTRPENKLLRLGHSIYLRTVVPLVGKLMTTNGDAYHYLKKSVETFISGDELQHTMRMSGFHHSWRRPMTGGIATLFFGQKGAARCVSEQYHNRNGVVDYGCALVT